MSESEGPGGPPPPPPPSPPPSAPPSPEKLEAAAEQFKGSLKEIILSKKPVKRWQTVEVRPEAGQSERSRDESRNRVDSRLSSVVIEARKKAAQAATRNLADVAVNVDVRWYLPSREAVEQLLRTEVEKFEGVIR